MTLEIVTEEQRGAFVAKAVWQWLQHQRSIQFVPWVLDPNNSQFDASKAKEQAIRDALLDDLEHVIKATSEKLR